MPTTIKKEPMSNKITQKIISYKVLTPEQKEERDNPVEITPPPITMNETIKREPQLHGTTTKLKPPLAEHSLYITINDQVLDGVRYPMEVFMVTKDPEHRMWIDALAVVISAVFKKGSDVSFLVDEFSSVFDPKGGYFGKNRLTGKGKYYNSIIHEVGNVLEAHLKSISDSKLGISNSDFEIEVPSSDSKHTFEVQDAERIALLPSISLKEVVKSITETRTTEDVLTEDSGYPPNATTCKKCYQKATVLLDGCSTCLHCGESKCG